MSAKVEAVDQPYPPTMEPLIGFLEAMSDQCADVTLRSDFGDILLIIQAACVNPVRTSKAVSTVLADHGSQRPVLASFHALPLGKKLLELADAYASSKLESHQFLSKLETVRVDCSAFAEGLQEKPQDHRSVVDEILRLTSEFIAACGLVPQSMQEENAVAAIKESRASLCELIKVTLAAHVQLDGIPWLIEVGSALGSIANGSAASLQLSMPPAWCVFKLRDVAGKLHAQKELENVGSVLAFYDAHASLSQELTAFQTMAATTDDSRKKATSLCARFTTWRNLFQELEGKLPTQCNFSELAGCCKDGVEKGVHAIFGEAWASVMSLPCKLLKELSQNVVAVSKRQVEGEDGKERVEGKAVLLRALTLTLDGLDGVDNSLEAAVAACNDASFLATGITDTRKLLYRATLFMVQQMDALDELHKASKDETVDSAGKTINAIFEVYKILLADFDDSLKLTLKLQLPVSEWKSEAEDICKTLFPNGGIEFASLLCFLAPRQ